MGLNLPDITQFVITFSSLDCVFPVNTVSVYHEICEKMIYLTALRLCVCSQCGIARSYLNGDGLHSLWRMDCQFVIEYWMSQTRLNWLGGGAYGFIIINFLIQSGVLGMPQC